MKAKYFCYSVVLFMTPLLLASAAPQEPKEWSQKMQKLARTFSDLLPILVSEKPATPEELTNLKKSTATLLSLAHAVKAQTLAAKPSPLPDFDPTLGFVSNLFEREILSASRALKYGQTEYAKRELRSLTTYCIACHTRHDQGPSFPALNLTPKTDFLTPMERAKLQAATRQFDAALDSFEKIAGDANIARKNSFEWSRAVREAFTLSVRVKQDPDRAMRVVDKILALPEIPSLFKEMVPIWKKHIQDWKSEKPKTFTTEEAWFKEAERLYQAAQKPQKYYHDRSSDILYLRFSLATHELLSRYPNGQYTGDALLLAGTAYELLDDWLISPLPGLYFETCIRKMPHTEVAHQCFLRYEEGIYFGYTGSAGTNIPDDVLEPLRELQGLATPR